MTLREKRVHFTRLLAKLIDHIFEIGYEVAIDEAMVHSPREGRMGNGRLTVEDAVHKRASLHYVGLAADLNLYHNGVYISDGSAPIWQELDDFCRRMDPDFGMGLAFSDPNHASLGETRRTIP